MKNVAKVTDVIIYLKSKKKPVVLEIDNTLVESVELQLSNNDVRTVHIGPLWFNKLDLAYLLFEPKNR